MTPYKYIEIRSEITDKSKEALEADAAAKEKRADESKFWHSIIRF